MYNLHVSHSFMKEEQRIYQLILVEQSKAPFSLAYLVCSPSFYTVYLIKTGQKAVVCVFTWCVN